MARATARPLPPRPVAVLPRWAVASVVLAALVAAAAAFLRQVDQSNQKIQAEHRLTVDPVLGAWLADMRDEIAAFDNTAGATSSRSGERFAEAVWLGRVRTVDFTTRQGEGPRLSEVLLDPAHLIAGRRSPLDPRRDGGVRISVLDHRWPRGEPREGESWVFAVSRINKGNNVTYAAFPAP